MEEYQILLTKVILRNDVEIDLNIMRERDVCLMIDASYTIGKSVAVIYENQVIGHLNQWVSKFVWLHLHVGGKMQGTVYDKLNNGFKNSTCFSTLTMSREIGIQIQFYYRDYMDGVLFISGNSQAKLFLAYAIRHHLTSFPGVTLSNCPPELKPYFH